MLSRAIQAAFVAGLMYILMIVMMPSIRDFLLVPEVWYAFLAIAVVLGMLSGGTDSNETEEIKVKVE